MSLVVHFFKVFSLYLEVSFCIRIKVKGRLPNNGRTFQYMHPNKGVFCLLLSLGSFTSVYKVIKKSENCRNQGFSLSFFACWWKNPDPVGQDSDSEHCFILCNLCPVQIEDLRHYNLLELSHTSARNGALFFKARRCQNFCYFFFISASAFL